MFGNSLCNEFNTWSKLFDLVVIPVRLRAHILFSCSALVLFLVTIKHVNASTYSLLCEKSAIMSWVSHPVSEHLTKLSITELKPWPSHFWFQWVNLVAQYLHSRVNIFWTYLDLFVCNVLILTIHFAFLCQRKGLAKILPSLVLHVLTVHDLWTVWSWLLLKILKTRFSMLLFFYRL